MKKIFDFLKQIITSHSGISSKRVCGVIGFIVLINIIIYCTIKQIQAPEIMNTFIFAICLLLGIDSVTGIFYKNNKNG